MISWSLPLSKTLSLFLSKINRRSVAQSKDPKVPLERGQGRRRRGRRERKGKKTEKILPCSKGEIKIASEESKKDDGI